MNNVRTKHRTVHHPNMALAHRTAVHTLRLIMVFAFLAPGLAANATPRSLQLPDPDRVETTSVGRDNPADANRAPDVPWLGISRWLSNQTEVVICGVLANGPAGKAGMKTDDVIVSIDGRPVTDLGTFHRIIDELPIDGQVEIVIRRNSETLVLPVRMETIPADGGLKRIAAAATRGETWAMMEMGVRLAGFRGNRSYVEKDPQAAAQWFWRAIDSGNTAAPFFLGRMYLTGDGVPKDPDVARELFVLARKNADTPALTGVRRGLASAASLELAWLCLNGSVPGAPPELAIGFLKDAANNGSPLAMTRFGDMHGQGDTVPRDENKMRQWYELAAKTGFAPAVERLSRIGNAEPVKPAQGAEKTSANNGSAAPRPSSTAIVSDGRCLWIYGEGWFRHCGEKTWIETARVTDRPAGAFRFQETTRNNDYVELFDATRNFTVRLTKDSMLIRQKPDQAFGKLYQGQWWNVTTSQPSQR